MLLQTDTIISIVFAVNIVRCVAISKSKVGAFELGKTPSSPLNQSALPNLHFQNKNVVTTHWDCQGEKSLIQDHISFTTKMLQDGNKFLEKQKGLLKEYTVLVLGRAGCGKSSLVQFLTGNTELSSGVVKAEAGEYIIDGDRIGTSTTESYTLYPELVNYNSTINFCDSPGFHDSRSSAHEIVLMDIMKSITNGFKKVKILLLENHSSLQYGVSKDNFMNLMQHLNNFIVDFDKYKDNIVLVATKVPFTYRMTDDKNIAPEFIPAEILIESILDFLNRTEIYMREKLNSTINKNEREFYSKGIRLLQSLQTKDEGGKPTRINIFRRPYKIGLLKDMHLLEDNKKSLLDTVMNLEFVKVKRNDFDFTLSDTAKLYLECLLKTSNDYYKSRVDELSLKLGDYINSVGQKFDSFHTAVIDLKFWRKKLGELLDNLDKAKNYDEFLKIMFQFISTNKIPLKLDHNGQDNVLKKYEIMLRKFVDTSSISTPTAISIKQVIKSVEGNLQWYKTLLKLIVKLSSYDVQSKKTEISENIQNGKYKIPNLFSFLIGADELFEIFDIESYIEVQRDSKKAAEVQSILKTMLQQNNITCNAEGRIVVRGSFVRLAEINSKGIIQLYCKDIPLREVAILAVDTLFIDEDTDNVFKEVNLFVAAPNWEVIGSRRIDLSGWPGKPITKDSYFDNKKNGKPGLAGGNGGNFFGIGLRFSNGGNLAIKSNGGNGGPGVDGRKGNEGEAGKNGIDKAFDEDIVLKRLVQKGKMLNPFSKHDYYSIKTESDFLLADCVRIPSSEIYDDAPIYTDNIIHVKTHVYWFVQNGDCGGYGGYGGNGGEGGFGGLSGKQQLIELSESSHIFLESKNGSRGSRGGHGAFGMKGKNGMSVTYFNVLGLENDQETVSYWKLIETENSSCVQVEQNNPFLNHNFSYMTDKMIQPAPTKSSDLYFSYHLFDYEVLMKVHSENAVFNKTITDFRTALKNKFFSNQTDMVAFLLLKNQTFN